MFFRLRGNNVQLVKSIEVESGNKKSVPVGSINLINGNKKIKEGIKLNKDDEKEISQWMDERKVIDELQKKLNALTIDEKIQQVANDINSKNVQITSNQFEKISESFRSLRRVYNKNKDLDGLIT